MRYEFEFHMVSAGTSFSVNTTSNSCFNMQNTKSYTKEEVSVVIVDGHFDLLLGTFWAYCLNTGKIQ